MTTDTPTDTPTPSFPPLKLECKFGKIVYFPSRATPGRLYVSIEISSYDFNEESSYVVSMDELKQIRDWADSLLQDNEQEGH